MKAVTAERDELRAEVERFKADMCEQEIP